MLKSHLLLNSISIEIHLIYKELQKFLNLTKKPFQKKVVMFVHLARFGAVGWDENFSAHPYIMIKRV